MNTFTHLLAHTPSLMYTGSLAALAGLVGYGMYKRFVRGHRLRLFGRGALLTVGVPTAKDLGVSEDIGTAFTGFITDVMKEMAGRLGRRVEVKTVPMSDYEALLINKTVDIMLLDGTTAVACSKEIEVIPSHTAALSSLALVFWDKMPHHVDTLQDFAYYAHNSTVVLKDSLEDHYLAMYDGIPVHRVDSITNLIVNLKLGLARAGLMRMEHAHYLRREYSNIKYLPISLQKRCVIQDEKMGVLRENQELITAVEQTLSRMRRDQTMRHLHGRWFGV